MFCYDVFSKYIDCIVFEFVLFSVVFVNVGVEVIIICVMVNGIEYIGCLLVVFVFVGFKDLMGSNFWKLVSSKVDCFVCVVKDKVDMVGFVVD